LSVQKIYLIPHLAGQLYIPSKPAAGKHFRMMPQNMLPARVSARIELDL